MPLHGTTLKMETGVYLNIEQKKRIGMPLHGTTLKIETEVYLNIEQKKRICDLHCLNIPEPEGVILECLEYHDICTIFRNCYRIVRASKKLY